jgi:hypothetical protein
MLGENFESVSFYTGKNNEHKLCELAIANDFISIPMVTTAQLIITSHHIIKVKNAKGIKLKDVFVAMKKGFAVFIQSCRAASNDL